MTPAARLLRLLAILQSRPQWRGADLAERLGVSERTLRADIAKLRQLDYRIEATPGAAGGYQLRPGETLPPLRFDDSEAVAVAVGLQLTGTSGIASIAEAGCRAVAKLDQVLPKRLRNQLRAITEAAETIPTRRDLVAPDTFHTITSAVTRREQLVFDYTDRTGSNTRRKVEPLRLVHTAGRWYLVAYDLDCGEWRCYRADRIRPRTPAGPRFTPRPQPEPDLEAFVARGRMAAMWNYTAHIQVHAPVETVAARLPNSLWHVTASTYAGGHSLLEAGAQSPQLLAAYLAALDLDFHVDPDAYPELAHEITRIAARYHTAAPPG